jgi:hypothetical protein
VVCHRQIQFRARQVSQEAAAEIMIEKAQLELVRRIETA